MKIKDFRGITIRGLTAYGICCLENALLHYNLQEDEGWRLILERLWLYTSLPESKMPSIEDGNSDNIKDLDCLYCFYCDSLPHNVTREVEGKKQLTERRIKTFSSDKIALLYQAYKKANEVVLEIVDTIVSIATTEMNGWYDYPTAPTLYKLEVLLKTMQDNDLPLPGIERFKKYELGFDPLKNISTKFEAKAWGAPFNGRAELSKILK